MRKLPKFIYDEDKALEDNRGTAKFLLTQLNSAVDEVSAQLHPEDGIAVASDEIQASIQENVCRNLNASFHYSSKHLILYWFVSVESFQLFIFFVVEFSLL
ncbi:hypothetical protein NC651_013163 [Populus alba x Populus x berolinensis]|nr:hypothetical protein NC651_013163 [Populus alba x Populus x berolinensis]